MHEKEPVSGAVFGHLFRVIVIGDVIAYMRDTRAQVSGWAHPPCIVHRVSHFFCVIGEFGACCVALRL